MHELVREVPASTRQTYHNFNHSDEPGGGQSVVEAAAFPESAIKDIVINEGARQFLDPRYYGILSPDFLLSLARFTIPFEEGTSFPHSKKILVPREFGRGLILGDCRIPYGLTGAKIMGTTITSKGNGPSGQHYPLGVKQAELTYLNSRDPIGFLGDRSAQQDMDGSNILLKHQARSSLCLGYLILDPDKLKQFIAETWGTLRPSETLLSYMHGAIDQVVRDGQQPAILFRLGGVRHRLDITFACQLPAMRSQPLAKAAIRSGMRLMAQELTMPDSYLANIGWDQRSMKKALDLMIRISKGETLPWGSSMLLLSYIDIICHADGKRLEQCLQRHPEFKHIIFDEEPTVWQKDVDFSLVRYDFEKIGRQYSIDPNDSISNRIQALASKTANVYEHWLCFTDLISGSRYDDLYRR